MEVIVITFFNETADAIYNACHHGQKLHALLNTTLIHYTIATYNTTVISYNNIQICDGVVFPPPSFRGDV